jgi:hypothetical protein
MRLPVRHGRLVRSRIAFVAATWLVRKSPAFYNPSNIALAAVVSSLFTVVFLTAPAECLVTGAHAKFVFHFGFSQEH